MNEIHCSACGKEMPCGFDDPAGCWCADQPPLAASEIVSGTTCLCKECLKARYLVPNSRSPASPKPGTM